LADLATVSYVLVMKNLER